MHTVPRGMMEAIDVFIGEIEVPIHQMGLLVGQMVTVDVGMGNQIMPLSSAALLGFIWPWLNGLGGLLVSIANFMDVL